MTATSPSISIVIPSLNQRAFLEQAIGSVLDQRLENLELIVIDGGSTDGSAEWLASMGDRFTYWVSRPDSGPADALREGCRRATGDVLAVLNADDFYLPGGLRIMVNAFVSHPAADVIAAHGYFASEDGTLGAAVFSDRWDLDRFRYGGCVLLQQATLFRRSAFERAGGFRTSRSLCWDMELWADLATAGARFQRIDHFVAAFRLHPASITGRADLIDARRRDARAIMARLRGRPESSGDRWRHRMVRAQKFLSHPVRTFRQRLYFKNVLGRWSL